MQQRSVIRMAEKETKNTKQGIADYLALFERSPYAPPKSAYQRVEGISTLKGSWLLCSE